MSGSSYRVLRGRNKRSDCRNRWDISSSCISGCGDHCWRDSYRYNFSTSCGTDTMLHCCVIKDQFDYKLSPTCPAKRTYLNLECSKTGVVCWDSQIPYQCTCSEGYLANSHTITTRNTENITALGVTLPLILIGAVVLLSVLQYRRVYRRKKAVELEKKIKAGIIPIKCNVMILVDDLDEFKDYTTRLKVALQDIFPKIVCERLSTYNVINDRYEIKCDKLLVFRVMNKVMRKRGALTKMTEKIHFRNGRKISDIVLCEENDVKNNTRNGQERCLVSSMKNIGGWLPAVIQILFDIKEKNTNRYNMSNKTFFTKTEWCPSDSSYCTELRCTIENTLKACGATTAQSEDTAKCKLAFLDAKDDIFVTNGQSNIDLKGFFVFVSPGANVDSFRNNNDVHMYRSKEVILGVLRLLFKLKLISDKEMPSVRRVRYNPISQEFV